MAKVGYNVAMEPNLDLLQIKIYKNLLISKRTISPYRKC